MMFGECHAHIFMDGRNYKAAAKAHENGPREDLIRAHLKAYRDAGISFVRDGGDPYGADVLARRLAGEYGITYRIPVFAIHKKGHYGRIVGREFESMKEYTDLVKEVKRQGGDFIKIMTTGILDFAVPGKITGEALKRQEVFEMIHIAHEEGFAVMAHTNGAEAVIDVCEAGADSVEHGNYQNEESLRCMAECKTVWVPTIVTVSGLLGDGRYPDEALRRIHITQRENLKRGYALGIATALGSDAGAYGVPHGTGILEEYRIFREILEDDEKLPERLNDAEQKIREFFVLH